MARKEHVAILRRGAGAWNRWRKEHANVRLSLSKAQLAQANLSRANLSGIHLDWADLSEADLTGANLSGASLLGANLSGADLTGANLSNATLMNANLSAANLTQANLTQADLSQAHLLRAHLRDAHLFWTDLTRADLTEADLALASVGWTVFGDVDLSVAKGLDTVRHRGPSTIGIDTIYNSGGNISEVFLRKAGVQETFLTNMHALVDSMRPFDFYSCFISYSSKDQSFAERLYADLQSQDVRCWFAPQDMKTGDEIRSRIDEAIRIHDKLLLVLSEHSIESTWVKKEVETAFEKEDQQERLVLFPIRLDDTVMQTSQAWAADIRRMRHITDFTGWEDHDIYQKALDRLLRDLKAEAEKAEER